MKVVTLTSKLLAPRVAKELGAELIRIPYMSFPDGEGKYILYENLKDEEICYIQSLYPDQFGSLVRTCFALDLLNKKGTSSIKAIIPYLPFQRQDKPPEYESRNAEIAIKILSNFVSELYTVDAHSELILKKYDFLNLDPSDCIINYLKEKSLTDSLIVAPDINARRKAKTIASALNLPYIVLHKHRDEKGKVYFEEASIKTDAKNAIIIDDCVSAGSTLKKVAEILKRSGVEEMSAIVTHALLSEKTENEILNAGIKEIISTDSIENKFSKISLSSLIVNLFS